MASQMSWRNCWVLPSAVATASRVTSSSVGPKPPVRITSSERAAGGADGFGQPIAVVAHDGLGGHFDAQRVELIGEPKGIGVHALRREQLGADAMISAFI